MNKRLSKASLYSFCKKVKTFLTATLILFLCQSNFGFGQSTLIKRSSSGFDELNSAQQDKIDLISQQDIYSDMTLIEIDIEALFDENGLIKTNTDNFLDSMTFKSFIVNYQDASTFSWTGKYFAPVDTLAYNSAFIALSSHDGIIMGNLQSENRSFQIHDLTGGLYVLAEYSENIYAQNACMGTLDDNPPITMTTPICGQQRTKILFIYTQDGYNLLGTSYIANAHNAVLNLNMGLGK